MVVAIRSSKLLRLGLEAIGYNDRRQDRAQYSTNVRRFRSAFGAGPLAISVIFRDLQTTSIPEARIDRPIASHLLVAMNWLTVYDNKDNMAGTFRCCENTLRNRIWKYVNAIAALKDQKIVWDIDSDPETFLLSVDGVHFRIHEMRKVHTNTSKRVLPMRLDCRSFTTRLCGFVALSKLQSMTVICTGVLSKRRSPKESSLLPTAAIQ